MKFEIEEIYTNTAPSYYITMKNTDSRITIFCNGCCFIIHAHNDKVTKNSLPKRIRNEYDRYETTNVKLFLAIIKDAFENEFDLLKIQQIIFDKMV